MNYYEFNKKNNEEYKERFELVSERLKEIAANPEIKAPYDAYFKKVASFSLELKKVAEGILENPDYAAGDKGRELNETIFINELRGKNYETSFFNPTYCVKELGQELGGACAAVYALFRKDISGVYQGDYRSLCLHSELLVELYVILMDDDATAEQFIEAISSFMHDNIEFEMENLVSARFGRNADLNRTILMESDLSNSDFLYKYGQHISDNEQKIFEFLKNMSQEELQSMADTYTEGFRLGFIACNKPLEKKNLVEVMYPIGFEPMVRLAVKNFEKMNLYSRCIAVSTLLNKQYVNDHGYKATLPEGDKDMALWLDKSYVERQEEFYKKALESYKEEAAKYAGPAVIETFGEVPFEPESREANLKMSAKQQELAVTLISAKQRLLNQYIHGEERSFTIISYPIPEIGDKFSEIFAETVKVNTLDYKKYQGIQQKLIDVLDTADHVHVLGKGENKTDITVKIHELKNPSKETAFENCVADVNIPVGEVFTSPVLEGTNGKLHVTQVYLEGRNFLNLEIDFKDGMICDYTCTNFEDEKECKRYIEDEILYNHESLPIGEFAIGTNTTAYRMGIEYGIQDKLPILIAEKTGPHFAVGDTCYTYDEDNETFNPDGKAIVARDNSVSILRKTDISKAYFNCHTDITIPYNELKSIVAIAKDGTETPIILDGRFVVPGTEELNVPLEGLL